MKTVMVLVMVLLSNFIQIALREHVVVLFIKTTYVPNVPILRVILLYGRMNPVIVVPSQGIV